MKNMLESDSLVTIQKIQTAGNARDPHHHLVETMRKTLQRDWMCVLQYLHKETSKCAD